MYQEEHEQNISQEKLRAEFNILTVRSHTIIQTIGKIIRETGKKSPKHLKAFQKQTNKNPTNTSQFAPLY